MSTSLSGFLVRSITRRPVVIRSVPVLSVANFSTSSKHNDASDKLAVAKTEKQMSSAMKMYLKRKRDHDMFISRERAEFDIGKEHLANMMGMEASTMTQEQIDSSIEYLFPSGLNEEAKPVMKPPEEIFAKQKEAEFDMEGRPFHPFFYTLKPNYNHSLFTLRDHIDAVTVFGDRLKSQGKGPDPEQVLNAGKLADSRWVTVEEMSKICLETVTEAEHKEFLIVLERLTSLPFSYRVRDEIFKWRMKEVALADKQQFITPKFDEQGRAWVEVDAQRKTAVAKVKLTKPGTGLVEISHKESLDKVWDITYFYALKDRHQILYPLQFTKLLGLVDMKVEVEGSGPSGQAGAIRYGLAMALRSFVDKNVVGDMKLVGLLTQDIRVRERKKPGKVKARKGYTWKRR